MKSKKIIGVTVGSPLPKPNLKQTDPRKGDYVKGKDIIPSKVSDLENDAGFLTEHQDISGKLDADKLPEAITEALAQAKASGAFDGDDYVLTPADKAEIAEMAADLVEVPAPDSGGNVDLTDEEYAALVALLEEE